MPGLDQSLALRRFEERASGNESRSCRAAGRIRFPAWGQCHGAASLSRCTAARSARDLFTHRQAPAPQSEALIQRIARRVGCADDAVMDKQNEKLIVARRQLDLLTAVGAALLVAVVVYAVYTVA